MKYTLAKQMVWPGGPCSIPLASQALCVLIAAACLGCSSRALTPPRSEVLKQARSNGSVISTPEEDRAKFEAYQSQQRARLLALLRERTESGGENSGYVLGPRDQLEISVFEVPELNQTVRVKDSGAINLPLIGIVQVAGRTEQQLIDELTRKVSRFVRQPQVSVYVAQYGSQKVAVVGAVQKPGSYALSKGENSILELLAEAGGVAPLAGNYVSVVPGGALGGTGGDSPGSDIQARARASIDQLASFDGPGGGSGNGAGIEIPLDAVLGTSGGVPIELPILAGDMLVIPESGTVSVEGEVQKTGAYELGRKSSLLGALAAAGGITYGAKVDEVEVVRDLGSGEKVHLVFDLQKVIAGEQSDMRLRSGDVVRVPSDSGRRLRQDTFEAIGRVVNFGVGGSVNVVN